MLRSNVELACGQIERLQAGMVRKSPSEKLAATSGNLTLRQRAFLDAYVTNGWNASTAYRTAYGSKASPAACSKEGQKLLKHPLIAPQIAHARAKVAEITEQKMTAANLTREWVLDRLIHEASTSTAGPRIAALGLLGKTMAMFVDSQQQLGPDGKPVAPGATFVLKVER